MSPKINIIQILLFVIGVFFLTLFTYRGIHELFFQQDEWMSLGLVQADGLFAVVNSLSFFQIISGTLRFIGTVSNNALHLFFPLQTMPFAIFAIVVHSINTILVYIFVRRLTNVGELAISASILFCCSYIASQSLIWFSAHTTTLGSTTFMLLSLYVLLSNVKYNRSIALIFAYLAILTKESTFILLLLLPIVEILKTGKPTVSSSIRVSKSYFLSFLLLVGIRFFGFAGGENQQGVFLNSSNSTIYTIIGNFFLYPVVGFGHYFMAFPGYLSSITKIFNTMYPIPIEIPIAAQIVGTVFSDFISMFVTLIICIVLFLFWEKLQQKRMVLFSVYFVLLSFLPYSVLFKGFNGLFESRYYYVGMIGASLFIAMFLSEMLRIMIRSKYVRILLLITIFTLYLLKQSQWIYREVEKQKITAFERKNFIYQLKRLYPTIPENTVFLIEGDSPGMYGISDLSVPFQQGMGYTLMVLYYDSNVIPKQLLREGFLWNINAQGFAEVEGKSFGYFWNYADLSSKVINKEILLDRIISLKYTSNNKVLIDSTEQIKARLIAELTI